MGVIKKILYRGDALSSPRHRHLFLDIEENIHIHYRDLRIELSRKEFEDIATIFNRQSAELLDIIEKKDYQDGKLPNANQEDVRIWTKSRLDHDLKYHPRRLSLEECSDGYHFHYRNIKLLIDPVEFRHLVQRFQRIDLDSGYAQNYEEVLELIEANDIDFVLSPGNLPGELLAIAVAPYHLVKVKEIFGHLGFDSEAADQLQRYRGKLLAVNVAPDRERSPDDYKKMRSFNKVGRLVDILAKQGSDIDGDELNHLKCQVLDLYYGLRSGQHLHVETDPQLWLYVPEEQKIVFPYHSAPKSGKQHADALYRDWANLLKELDLHFVKPDKVVFDPDKQGKLQAIIRDTLLRDIASCVAVNKIWLMGSAARSGMGVYHYPFVHGKQAKLGSDVDILIEMDPQRETHVPKSWQLIRAQSSNYCSVYHLSQIDMEDNVEQWTTRFPNLTFLHHLIDAYVFFPSNGHLKEKDDFLDRMKGKLLYHRARDGNINRGDEEVRLAKCIGEQYSLYDVAIEKMTVSTENGLYKVFSPGRGYVLKQFKLAGNYRHHRVNEHTEYETNLINQLVAKNVPTAAVIPNNSGNIEMTEEWPSVLFEWLPGEIRKQPEYDVDNIARALAQLHQVQLDQAFDLPESFLFEEYASMWLNALADYANRSFKIQAIDDSIAALAPLAEQYDKQRRDQLVDRSQQVHCHGDVAPKNIMIGNDGIASLFDFNNAFYGPRMVDVIDAAIELSLAEKYIDQADFARFDNFIEHYVQHSPLSALEQEDLDTWIELINLIMFTKEVRVLLIEDQGRLRERRALAIAEFLRDRHHNPNSA